MAKEAMFFSNDTTASEIFDFLRENYGIIENRFKEGSLMEGVSCGSVSIDHNERTGGQQIWVYLHGMSAKDEAYPERVIGKKSIYCSTSSLPKYAEVLENMARQLGGYFCADDSVGYENPLRWKKYEGKNFKNNRIADKIYTMLQKDREEDVRNVPNAINTVEFIMRHLDEIRAL